MRPRGGERRRSSSGGRRLLAAISLALISLLGWVAPARGQLAASPWPMFQHDLRHSGHSTLAGSPQPRVEWTFPTALEPATPVVGSDGTIYLPAGQKDEGQGTLYAISPQGSVRWAFALPGPPASSAPAIAADGTVYVHANGPGNISGIATLTAINPNGSQKWQFQFSGGAPTFSSSVLSSPAIAGDGRIWVGSIDAFLYSLNPANGSVSCAVSPSASSISASPAIGADGTVYVVDVTNTLFAFAPNCALKWGFQLAPFAGGDQSSPTVAADGTIWVGSQDQGLYGISPNGTLRCRFSTGSEIRSTPAIGPDGTVYVGSDGLYAVKPENCAQRWSFRPFLAQFSSASPVVGGDGAIYWRESFNAYALNPNGTRRWSVPTSASSGPGLDPSPAIGSLYWADGGFPGDPRRLRAFVSGPIRCKGKLATMYGTSGKDKLTGSRLPDVIVGLNGKDRLSGGKGNDVLCGGKGKDGLGGGPGKDILIGGKGRDSCSGGKGRDRAKSCEQKKL